MMQRWLAWLRADATQRDVLWALAESQRQYPDTDGLNYANIRFWIGFRRSYPSRFALWRAVTCLVWRGRLIVQDHPARLTCAFEGGWYGVGHWVPGYQTYHVNEVPA